MKGRVMRHIVSLFAAVMAVVVSLVGMAQAQSGGNYLINPGDTLQIEVVEDADLNRSVLVTPDGRISFPFAGAVPAAGRTVGQVERALSTAMSGDFASPPTVFVSVASIPEADILPAEEGPTIDIYILGEVAEPGPKAAPPGVTVLQALSLAGGVTRFAATKRVQLRRRDPGTGREYVYPINYKAITEGARLEGNVMLGEGDVILVPERRLFE
jgi:polysaccharide biosynthesis/export protein